MRLVADQNWYVFPNKMYITIGTQLGYQFANDIHYFVNFQFSVFETDCRCCVDRQKKIKRTEFIDRLSLHIVCRVEYGKYDSRNS